jgi:hypothetical protein
MESILDKIKKLMAHQESAEQMGSIHEAEAFAAKIQKMMHAHNISLKDISFEDLKENVKQEYLDSKIASVSYSLGYFIMYPIAKYNWCRVYIAKRNRMLIVGSPENIEACKMIYDTVLAIFLKVGKEKYKTTNKAVGLDTYLREFLQGCANGLADKFKAERKILELQNSSSTALIVRNDKAVEAYVEKTFKVGKSKAREVKKSDAYFQGLQTGRNVELNKKISE